MMVSHPTAPDAGGASALASSPRRAVGESGNGYGPTAARRTGCTRSNNLLTVLALAMVAGFTTIVLQLMASERNGPRHASESMMRAELPEGLDEEIPPHRRQPAGAGGGTKGSEYHAYSYIDSVLDIPAPSRLRRIPLVDRRFAGQRTGRPPMPEEEVPSRPPAPPDGPFGWNTDWITGVGLPGPTEDIIEPAWCQTSAGNASFAESVMARRTKDASLSSSDRVASCTRTKDRGRYLPEWVAYHWALGVDFMDIYDDDSVDDTRQVVEPFWRAGILQLQLRRARHDSHTADEPSEHKHERSTTALAPVNECVERYRLMNERGDPGAPRWLVLVDTDELLWLSGADTNSSASLPELLDSHSSTCCLQVPVVQHGTSGFGRTPRGLLLENFLTHADPASTELNGTPKIIIDLRPSTSEEAEAGSPGESSAIPSSFGGIPDGALGTLGESCRCKVAPVAELAVRRYPVTREDLVLKKRRYAELRQQQPQLPMGGVEFDERLESEALNGHKSDGILAWRCVVRRVLARAANGFNVVTAHPESGLGLSPHHPITQGVRAMDPLGEEEANRTSACIEAVRLSPTVLGTGWGPYRSGSKSPLWVQLACSSRYVFLHSFEGTGEKAVLGLLASHPWVKSHVGQTAATDGGCALTSAISTAVERKRAARGMALSEMCGCTEEISPGCWRFCPKLQRRILTTSPPEPPTPPMALSEGESGESGAAHVNRTRRQLVRDWLLRFDFKPAPEHPVVLVERDPDFLLVAKQGLFPFVSTSVLTVRHPLCAAYVAADGRNSGGAGATAAFLREWRVVWEQVLIGQAPLAKGDVWVVRYEDLLSQEEEVASALWAAIGLPPLSPHAFSAADDEGGLRPATAGRRGLRRLIGGDALARAAPEVRIRVLPPGCRATVASCKRDASCELELLRSSSLLDFFGYGGDGALLSSQRFLWGKEELEWLGKRLEAERTDNPDDRIKMLDDEHRGGPHHSDDEPSVILPQAPLNHPQRQVPRSQTR